MTFEQTLDAVMGLYFEQREMLLKIVRQRDAEKRRQQLSIDANQALAEHSLGKAQPMTAVEAISLLDEFDDE